jgi:hypothetical protein
MLKARPHAAWFLAVAATAAIALVSGAVFVIAAAVDSGDEKSTVDAWQRSIAWPTGVRRTGDKSALVAYDVPAGHPDCVRNPEARITAENPKELHVSLTYELSRVDCTATVRGTITVSSRWLLRTRTIIVNGEPWAPGPHGYHRCPRSGCLPR